MRILQILPELNVGGVETGTVDLAKYLKAKGHYPVVVSHGGGLVEHLEQEGIKHYKLPVHQKNLFTMIYCVGKLIKIINDEKIDIVHARSRVPAWIGFFATRKTSASFVTTCHGYYSKHLFSYAMGWGKKVIAISQVIARHMVQDFKVPSEHIRVIARSVDTSKFNIPRDESTKDKYRTVVMVGRITPLKGHPYFIKAMALVLKRIPNLRVWIIGDAPSKKQPYKQELISLTARLGLSPVIEFLGNRRDIPQLLSQADCLVLSTVTQEAFGRVIIEAQAAGVPVVATSVGGVTEVIDDGKTGLLVLPKDSESLAQAVIKILNNPSLARNLVNAAKVKIENLYTLSRMADATINVYREVIERQHILIIKLSAIGDVILSTAAFEAIRKKFPHATIDCLTSHATVSIVGRCKHINNVYVIDPADKSLKGMLKIASQMRGHRFDKVIDLQNNRISHLLSFLIMPKESYGYDNGKWSFLLTHKIKNDLININPVEHQFRILKMLGINYHGDERLLLDVTSKEEEYVQQLLDSEWLGNVKDMVGINIAASNQWATKNWPIMHIVKLCDLLGAKNIRVVLTGQDKDKPRARQIIAKAKARPADMVGKTNVLQLAALIKRFKAYVSLDSAPLHVASSVNVPAIALFGPTDPKRHVPPGNVTVLKRDLKCAPCYSGTCKITTHACMQEITPESVVAQLKKIGAV